MKKLRFKNAILIIVALMIFSACEEDEKNDPGTETITTMVEATSYTDWVYYSLPESKVVDVTDPKTSTNWDLAFMRNHLRTNSGSSGNGAGGALDAGVVDFDSYILAPETGYAVDDSIRAFDFASMEYHKVAANTVLETWGTFTEDMPPVLEPANKAFVVKTALGKYAKIIILNYYGNEGSGYITFKYLYQADGSAKLE